MTRPASTEFAPYYARYVECVPGDDVIEFLEAQRVRLSEFIGALDQGSARHRYAEGKWSVAEVIGHVIDVERVMATRALAFARGHAQAWPGIEQDPWVEAGRFDARSPASLRDEFDGLRRANVALFASFDDAAWNRRGTASGCEFTVRALAWIVAGHAEHHARVLHERYRLP